MTRFIDTGDRRWTAPPVREWPWSVSKKGNTYTKLPNGDTVVIVTREGDVRGSILYTWIRKADERWVGTQEVFHTLDDCKRAALRAHGVSVKEPVPAVDADPDPGPGPVAQPVRKIVTD